MARKKRREELEVADIPISSMIDIIFLLIIFFVVTAALDKEVEDEVVKLSKAPHGQPVKKKNPRSLTINVRPDGSMNVGGVVMSTKKIEYTLRTVANKWYSGNPKNLPIIIRGDNRVKHGHIQKAMDAVTNTGLYRVKFMAVIEN